MPRKPVLPPDPAAIRREAEDLARRQPEKVPDPAGMSPAEVRTLLDELRVHQIELVMQNDQLLHTQEQLAASQARYFDLYDLAPVGYCTLSAREVILEANHTAREMLCPATGSLVRQPITRFLARDDQDIYYLHRKKFAGAIGPHSCELRLLNPEGEPFWAQVTTTQIPTDTRAGAAQDPDTAMTLLVLSDISQIKLAEADKTALAIQLHLAKRLETLGILSAGFSQEFNQLLAAILDQASSARRDAEGFAALSHHLGAIEDSTLRAMDLVHQILAYAGKAKWNLAEVDLGGVAREAAQTLGVSLPEQLTFTVDLAEHLPDWRGDSTQALQVLMNLLVNAMEAFPVGGPGTITLSTRAERIVRTGQGPGIWVLPVLSGNYVVLEVADTGKGMSPDLLYHAFEPFHTTKASGRGLGLAAVHGILSGHGGGLWVASAPGQGTSIKVYLPAQPEPAGHGAVKALAQWWGQGTILVVDPDPDGRAKARAVAEQSGFSVLEARGGIEAVELVRLHQRDLVLVLLDKGLKGSSARETLTRIRLIDARIPVLVTWSLDQWRSDPGPGRESGTLRKPYQLPEFQTALRQALEPHA